jgi:hypothetical protein
MMRFAGFFKSIGESDCNRMNIRVQLRELAARSGRLVELGLLGHPLKYSRPYIQGDYGLPRGSGEYETPEAFRLNNQKDKFDTGQAATQAQARKNGMISLGLKKTAPWKDIAEANDMVRAADVKRGVLRHEIVHSIQRAKAEVKGKSYTREMLNPIKRYIAEVGAYAAQNRRMPSGSLSGKLFPTFKAMLAARRSM